MRHSFTVMMVLWFILVNASQFIPVLNRVEPSAFGIPFNLLWIWSLNLLISVYLVYCAIKVWKTYDIDVEKAQEEAINQGLEVKR
ncbi:MAG TPA: hypothetical protein DEO65_03640 [Bacillus bacterium]|uniref:hypothetical protein n=1 Tax=Siminovitchia fordii TaxID=254759 RepID=UPI00037E3ADE|nr:hypothetical protein [Siminovitchia fordii]HBZ08965.1 hypothetical protein [Bacillus sp. (in: firmicutes)]